MSKELTPLEAFKYVFPHKEEYMNNEDTKYTKSVCLIETTLRNEALVELKPQVKKKLKAFEIISQNFKLVGNCLHSKNEYAESGWVFVKEIEDEDELEAWEEVLLCGL